MLIYSKKVDEKMKLFGTLSNIPSDEDELLTYTDGEGKEVEPALSLSQSFVDGGKHSIKRVEDGKEIKVFIGDVNVIPGEDSPVPPTPVVNPYLTFSSDSPFSISTTNESKSWDGTLEYSIDTENWTEWNGTEVNSNEDGKLYFRGSNNTVISIVNPDEWTSNSWVLNGEGISCIGNIENLLDYQTVMNGEHPQMGLGCYTYIFSDCTSLITAPELPATTLTESCYDEMFNNCTSLTTPPELPATTLANFCYANMFAGCTSLTTAPELPATTLAVGCYNGMFDGCTSLTMVPELPASTLAENCYRSMFYGCTSIKLSETQDSDYTIPYRIPKEGIGTDVTDALTDMFTNTGGTFTGTPIINTTYYLHKDNHIVG